MTIVDAHAPEVGIAPACRAVEVSRATWYRRRKKADRALQDKPRRPSPRRLSDDERTLVVDILCSEEFMDRSPPAVYAILLERGEYVCSVRTMYRILAEQRAVRERRRQRVHPEYTTPICCARGPNELWSWDITKLAGPNRSWFSLYVILDVYSRFVVGWLLAKRESAFLATKLIEQSLHTHEVDPTGLTIHADRGAPMRAKTLAQFMADLEIERSHSRPRVSNDNPFSESQFKTLKYCPQYPGSFGTIENAKSWAGTFFDWYNREHRHAGIGLFTPADVYTGKHLELTRARQRVLDRAYAAHPERFVRGRPTPPCVSTEVWINEPSETTMQLVDAAHRAPALQGGRGIQGGGAASPLVAAPETLDHAAVRRRRDRSNRPKRVASS
jgi:putative transposase